MIYLYTNRGQIFGIISQIFHLTMKDLGCDSRIVFAPNKPTPKRGDVVFVLSPPRVSRVKRVDGVIYVAYQVEQLPFAGADRGGLDSRLIRNQHHFNKLMVDYDYYLDYYDHQLAHQRRRLKIPAIHCPIGYHPCIDRTEKFPRKTTLDATFVGSVLPRRARILQRVKSKHKVGVGGIWGEPFYRWMRNAHVQLNIHPTVIPTFANLRIIRALSNRVLMVSEGWPGEVTLGRHIDVCDQGKFEQRIRYWKSNRELRVRREEEAYTFVREQYTSAMFLERALREIL